MWLGIDYLFVFGFIAVIDELRSDDDDDDDDEDDESLTKLTRENSNLARSAKQDQSDEDF